MTGMRTAIGVDFGSESARAVLVDVATGRELASAVAPFAHGVIEDALPDGGPPLPADWALQDPDDYVASLGATVRQVLRTRRAHCIEGAMLAACAFWVHGEPPLLLDMRAVQDFDHVVALYRRHGHWGAISKTNGIFLRSRDPVYRDLRELSMSYFHEYSNRRNHKTLREYSVPYDLRRIDPQIWVSGEKGAWEVAAALDEIRHFPLVTGRPLGLVSRRDPFERRAGTLSQYRTPRVLIEKEKLLKAKRALAARRRRKARA